MALVLAGFAYLHRRHRPTVQAGCLVAVDAQGSARIMRTAYSTWLPEEVKNCAARDRANVNVALISGETTTSTVTPVSADLDALDFTGNATDDQNLVSDKINQVVSQANKSILAAPTQAGGTDLVGLLCVAHAMLKGSSPSTLVINSDMMNNREPYVLRSAPLDPKSIAQAVHQLQASGQLCDLTGTTVYVYGAGIGSGTNRLTGDRLGEVQRFWQAIFSAAGANLVTYQRNP
jgi:hypothetical protein